MKIYVQEKNHVLMSSCIKKYKNEAKLSKSHYSLLATNNLIKCVL